MIAAALIGAALVTPAHPLQLECTPTDIRGSIHGHVLRERPGPWRAYRAGRLVAWFVTDSETIRTTRRVRVQWWCDR